MNEIHVAFSVCFHSACFQVSPVSCAQPFDITVSHYHLQWSCLRTTGPGYKKVSQNVLSKLTIGVGLYSLLSLVRHTDGRWTVSAL